MGKSAKSAQLQVRVSAAQKAAIQRAAARAGMDMSSYVLARALPNAADLFRGCIRTISGAERTSLALAELNDLLTGLSAAELRDAVASAPAMTLSPFMTNYVAAMVEYACANRLIPVPGWIRAIAPLDTPVFGSDLKSLHLHLLMHSPPPFRRRNIFIDSSLGRRV